MSSSRVRDSTNFVPAIPEGFSSVCDSRFFELNERVNVFDYNLLHVRPTNKNIVLPGQESLW